MGEIIKAAQSWLATFHMFANVPGRLSGSL